eukprot:scaffold7328_cov314-Pinguiococcus_pyrenoidosus.AAC.43
MRLLSCLSFGLYSLTILPPPAWSGRTCAVTAGDPELTSRTARSTSGMPASPSSGQRISSVP